MINFCGFQIREECKLCKNASKLIKFMFKKPKFRQEKVIFERDYHFIRIWSNFRKRKMNLQRGFSLYRAFGIFNVKKLNVEILIFSMYEMWTEEKIKNVSARLLRLCFKFRRLKNQDRSKRFWEKLATPAVKVYLKKVMHWKLSSGNHVL